MFLSFLISFVIGLRCYKKSSRIKYLFLLLVLVVVFRISLFFMESPDGSNELQICYPLHWVWDPKRTPPERTGEAVEWVSLRFLDYELWADFAHDGCPPFARSSDQALFQIFGINLLAEIVGFIIGLIISLGFQHRLRKHI